MVYAGDVGAWPTETQTKAIQLAKALDAPLVVVSVAHFALPAIGYAGYGYSNIVVELTAAEHERMEKLLAEVVETADAAGVSCLTFATDGVAVDEICRIANERDAQLIVVGSHGWGAARRFLS